MKSTFVILLACWAIFLAFGFINPSESQVSSCRKYEKAASRGRDVDDFMVEEMEKIRNELDFCKDIKMIRAAKKIIDKRREKLNEWMEMPGKLNKTEEMLNATEEAKMELEEQFGKCGKKLNEMEEHFGGCLMEMSKKEREWIGKMKEQIGKCRVELESYWPWKVLAFIFIGTTAALLLFISVVCWANFYRMGRNKI